MHLINGTVYKLQNGVMTTPYFQLAFKGTGTSHLQQKIVLQDGTLILPNYQMVQIYN
jgi:hypothetical protein